MITMVVDIEYDIDNRTLLYKIFGDDLWDILSSNIPLGGNVIIGSHKIDYKYLSSDS